MQYIFNVSYCDRNSITHIRHNTIIATLTSQFPKFSYTRVMRAKPFFGRTFDSKDNTPIITAFSRNYDFRFTKFEIWIRLVRYVAIYIFIYCPRSSFGNTFTMTSQVTSSFIDIISNNRENIVTTGPTIIGKHIANSNFTSNSRFNNSFFYNFRFGFMPRSFIGFISNFFAAVYCFNIRFMLTPFKTIIGNILNISLNCFGLCFSRNLTNNFRIDQITSLGINIIKGSIFSIYRFNFQFTSLSFFSTQR